MKRVIYYRAAQKTLMGFPSQLREAFAIELDRVTEGLPPTDWKPMKTVDVARERLKSIRGDK